MEAFTERHADEMMWSMVDDFPDEGLILVRRSVGVMMVASG